MSGFSVAGATLQVVKLSIAVAVIANELHLNPAV
jgi:hypothetical protein